MLGVHGPFGEQHQSGRLVRRPISFGAINPEMFASSVPEINDSVNVNDVNAFTDNLSDVLNDCARGSRNVMNQVRDNTNLSRWDRLM